MVMKELTLPQQFCRLKYVLTQGQIENFASRVLLPFGKGQEQIMDTLWQGVCCRVSMEHSLHQEVLQLHECTVQWYPRYE